jgi:MtN3 and saliva related transmembrane protein
MSIDTVDIIGGAAALCSVTSFAPQAVKIIRTGDTEGLSVAMYVLTVAGFSLWLAYGVIQRQWPLIATNACCLALSLLILVMLLVPAARRRASAISAKGGAP